MKKAVFAGVFAIVVPSLPALAQGNVQGTYAGVSQCYINGVFVTVRGNCPSTGASSSSTSGNSNIYGGLSQAGYQLGYAFGRWLFGGGSNPQQQLQQQQMMEELARREAEAERRHQEEEARRITAMYNRLYATLKLSGLPDLRLKGVSDGPGLQLKLGDDATGQAEIKGLPGIYLNDQNKPYGIPGLPGIYTGGPGEGSGLSNSKLELKTDDAATSPTAALPATETGMTMKTGDTNPAPAPPVAQPEPAITLEASKMTPQQLADVAEQFSKLPPEEQQRLMTMAQKDAAAAQQPGSAATPGQPSAPTTASSHFEAQPAAPASVPGTSQPPPAVPGQPMTPLNPQTTAPLEAQAAAAQAPVLEDASAKARADFSTPLVLGQLKLEGTGPAATAAGRSSALSAPPTPVIIPAAASAPRVTSSIPVAVPSLGASSPAPPGVAQRWVKLYLFPGSDSPFPNDPNPPLANPLREEQKVQAEVKAWDDWAIQRATHISAQTADMSYPGNTERAALNAAAVKQYAPDLLDRYTSDAAFRQTVDQRLQYTNEHVALAYYQGLAEAHKAAILEYRAELEKLAASGKIDKLLPLDDQLSLYPERRPLVQAVQDRVAAAEQAACAQAQADGAVELDKEYQSVFKLIRAEAK